MVMKPHLSAEGNKINWINYKTGVKDVHFKMDADSKKTSITIELLHKDDGIKELYWEQFLEFKNLFHTTLKEDWIWEDSSISITANGNIFDKNQWQDMFAFLKTRLLKFDEFWADAQEMFKSL